MSWEYDPLIAMCWWIAVVGFLVFLLLLTYYLYFVQPLYEMYKSIKKQVEALHGAISVKIIRDETRTLMTPIQTWAYIARHPLSVQTEPHL